MAIHRCDVARSKNYREEYRVTFCNHLLWYTYVTTDDSLVTCQNCLRAMDAARKKKEVGDDPAEA